MLSEWHEFGMVDDDTALTACRGQPNATHVIDERQWAYIEHSIAKMVSLAIKLLDSLADRAPSGVLEELEGANGTHSSSLNMNSATKTFHYILVPEIRQQIPDPFNGCINALCSRKPFSHVSVSLCKLGPWTIAPIPWLAWRVSNGYSKNAP